MPVITIHAPGEPDASLARTVADAVADALGLGPGDVLAAVVPTSPTVAGGGVDTGPWPIVTIRGSDRGAPAMAAARAAAEDALRRWAAASGLGLGGVWTEWLLPEPSPHAP